MKTFRNSGIELLRIVAMLQIVFLHVYAYSGYGAIVNEMAPIHGDIARLIWTFCRMSVDVFIIISGYFMVTASFDIRKTYKKIPKLYLQVIFYSLSIGLIFWISNPALLHSSAAVRAFFPILSRSWYFISLYILIVLLSPFINLVLTKISIKQYLLLLGLCFFMFSIWTSLSYFYPLNTVFGVHKVINTEYGFSLYSFIFMYIIGGFIRRFCPEDKKPKIRYLLAFIFLCLANYFINNLLTAFHFDYSHVFGNFDNPFMILSAVALFMFFRGINFKSRVINYISGATFGIYLIHEDPYIRTWMWKLFGADSKAFYNSPTYLVKIFLMVIFVFSACGIIEIIRQLLFKGTRKAYSLIKK